MKKTRLQRIRKAGRIQGKTLVFRNVEVSDAPFILSLRTDQIKARHLSQVLPDLQNQETWLEHYATEKDQAYFIIESMRGELLGTVRLYDQQGESFCWGSWILKDGAPRNAAIESALIVYSYAMDHLGFRASHFDVRKANESVWRFHERFGAKRIGENELDYLYSVDLETIQVARSKYRKFLPENVLIEELHED